uniref:mannose-1-phosphate guanylyltransferase n=1 Tax=Candidatus Kentrum sp. FW TaxID=2126338 RepID=A0A450SUP8_9GAMM|nr:MAG: mannose-1-phosphate guanylyltransferase (GDP) /mannose-6-phosphate isomerase, type 2 [Candidatus Kentron sp. FW]VFJ57710.1 MAG: mannose-1-phosphate guanylyltransferase (GDP) /mannose-6-phosphate isomerase, type 2 [Candidatus Kentron sp. FW]
MIIPVILCGGFGARLWPLSRKSFPKQFVPLIDNKSLLQVTLERVSAFEGNTICVGAEEHRFLIADSMQTAETIGSIILEPAARNTAAAMALASLYIKQTGQPDALLLFCPSDHYIPDIQAFIQTVQRGVPMAEAGFIVTFGVVPAFPSTAYGYIQQGAPQTDDCYRVRCFIEKPNDAKAKTLILQGNALWNAGIFLIRASTLLEALAQHAPDILQNCEQAVAEVHEESPEDSGLTFIRPGKTTFRACRSQSIDYAVMEKHSQTAVVPFKGQWSDVGSWNAVADLTPPDGQGNRIEGQGTTYLAENTYIHAPHRPVVALGTQDLLIIDTPDAVLVTHRQRVEQVKDVLAQLEKAQRIEAVTHRRVARPWGWYDKVDMGDRFQVKRITMKPGASISLQRHYHRAEHWIVVKGTARVTRGEETFLISENQSTYIPVGEIHRLTNPGKLELEMIEVQSGSYLGENDIQRLEDNYDGSPGKQDS